MSSEENFFCEEEDEIDVLNAPVHHPWLSHPMDVQMDIPDVAENETPVDPVYVSWEVVPTFIPIEEFEADIPMSSREIMDDPANDLNGSAGSVFYDDDDSSSDYSDDDGDDLEYDYNYAEVVEEVEINPYQFPHMMNMGAYELPDIINIRPYYLPEVMDTSPYELPYGVIPMNNYLDEQFALEPFEAETDFSLNFEYYNYM